MTINENAIRRLEKEMTEMEAEIAAMYSYEWTRQADVRRSRLHGMIAAIGTLGYTIEHDEDGSVRIVKL